MQLPSAPLQQSLERRLFVIALSGLLLLYGVLIAEENRKITRYSYGGLPAAYRASAALRGGMNPYERGRDRSVYVYPPLYAFLLTPLLRFSMQSAARTVLLLDAGFILFSMLLLSRIMLSRLADCQTRWQVPIVALWASVMLVVPIRNELHGLESNAPVLLCFVLALYWIDHHPILSGLALAVGINIKYLPLALLPYLLLRRRWTAAAATLFWTIVLGLLPAFALGWRTNLLYIRIATGGLLHLTGFANAAAGVARVPILTQDTSLSITSGVARLASSEGWPSAGAVGMIAVIAALWAGTVLAMYRFRRFASVAWPSAESQRANPYGKLFAVEWAGLIATVLALSPNTQDRLLVLAAFPATLAMTLLWFAKARYSMGPLAAGVTILFLGVLLPVSLMGRRMTEIWRSIGMPGWLVLIGSGLILWSALGYIRCVVETSLDRFNAEPKGLSAT